MLKNSKGFTLIELLIVAAIVGIIVVWLFGIKIVCQGNFWYTKTSVLNELKIDYPEVTEVLKTSRGVFDKSVITVTEGGERKKYCLDTDILWDYEFSNCED